MVEEAFRVGGFVRLWGSHGTLVVDVGVLLSQAVSGLQTRVLG